MVFKNEDTVRLKVKAWEIFRARQRKESYTPKCKMNTLEVNDKNEVFSREIETVKKKQMKNSEMKTTMCEINSLYKLCISID